MPRTAKDDGLAYLPEKCPHGYSYGIAAVRYGATVYLPECRVGRDMRPHLITKLEGHE